MAGTLSNYFRTLVAQGDVDFDEDTFSVILMASGFSFAAASYQFYSEVAAYELSTAYGYTVGGITLTGATIEQDDTDDVATCTFDSVSLAADGGDIGPFIGMCILDTTITDSPIAGYVSFGGSQTIADTGTGVISGITFQI